LKQGRALLMPPYVLMRVNSGLNRTPNA
jgi:hypothetical protein